MRVVTVGVILWAFNQRAFCFDEGQRDWGKGYLLVSVVY